MFCLAAAFLASWSWADRILLVPLDSRPAAGQFAQMIGNMADTEVILPPQELLGRFTQPGNPEGIMQWLRSQDYKDVIAVIVSTDMIAYGGLIASRTNDIEANLAISRLNKLEDIIKSLPNTKFYAFSSIMRLTPTATKQAAAWRIDLGKYAGIKERYQRLKNPDDLKSMRNLEAKIPSYEIEKYNATRKRNLLVNRELVQMVKRKAFDYLIFGQDDAQPFGPHIPETQQLRALAQKLGVTASVYFCEGIDQHSNVLVSRAMLRHEGWTPRVRIVYADDAGRKRIADYESKNIESSLSDQLFASGARPVTGNGTYDYTLYVNTPAREDQKFELWLSSLTEDVDQGFPVGVADINLAKDGTSDPLLFNAMRDQGRMVRLLSYAGWNTAGNTLGTAIPAANVYLLSRRTSRNPLEREIALREFLLHRFVNDYDYHKFVRPEAYKYIRSTPSASQEETYGEAFETVNNLVRSQLEKHLENTFLNQFKGQKFFAGNKQYEISALENVQIYLPRPRAYEVRLEFKMLVQEVGQNNLIGRKR